MNGPIFFLSLLPIIGIVFWVAWSDEPTPPCYRCGEKEFTDEIIDTDGGLQLGCIPIYARHKCIADNLGENI